MGLSVIDWNSGVIDKTHDLFERMVSVNRPARETGGKLKRDFRGHPKSKPGDLFKLTPRTMFRQ
jgi:hypothetical protein